MGMLCSRHRASTAAYTSVTVASHKLSREQIHMIDKYLPDFRISEPSTACDRQLAARHWDALFKERRRSVNRYLIPSLHISSQEHTDRTSSTTQPGCRLGALYDAFYAYLEQHSPELKPLFRSSMHVKSKVLVHISAGMRSLLASDGVAEKMAALTKTHVRLGVQLEHFNPLGKALLHAMAVVSEDAWTPEVADAWRHLFAHCSAMLLVTQKTINSQKSGGSHKTQSRRPKDGQDHH